MDRRRFLLTVGANKWTTYPFEFLYHSLIPTTINGSKVQDKAKLTKISGNGVVENQLVSPFDNTGWTSNIGTYAMVNSRKATITLTTNTGSSYSTLLRVYVNGSAYTNIVPPNHKVLVVFKLTSTKVSSGSNAVYIGNGDYRFNFTIANGINYIRGIINYTGTATDANSVISLDLTNTNYAVGDVITIEDYELIDLTLMFGTGNEPTTITDNRIQALLNRGYIAYNTGSYKNSRVGEIECEPYNLFDGELELGRYNPNTGVKEINSNCIRSKNYISVIGNTSYTLETPTTINVKYKNLIEFDENHNFVKRNVWYPGNVGSTTLDTSTRYISIYFESDDVISSIPATNNVCFHRTDTRTGYAPYQAPTKITLNGLLELNGAINSHDIFEITNTDYVFTRNITEIDMGDINWKYDTNLSVFYDQTQISNQKEWANAICDKYATDLNKYASNLADKTLTTRPYYRTVNVSIKDTAYTDAATFKTAMSGVMLYYELATPQVITIPKKHLGCVDLGSLSWNYSTWEGVNFFYANLSGSSGQSNIYCEPYPVSANKYVGGMSNKSIFITDRLYIRDDSITSASALKSALAGVYLFYETDAEVSDLDNVAQINAGGSINANEFSANFEQVIANGDFTDTSAWSFFSGDSGNTWSVGSNTAIIKMYSYGDTTIFRQQYTPVSGHKYLLVADYRVDTGTRNFSWVLGSNSVDFLIATTSWQKVVNIGTRTDANPTFGISLTVSLTTTLRLRNVKYIDLTETFGAGNEPTSENDYRVQYILNGGSLDAVVETEVLPNVNFKIKCK